MVRSAAGSIFTTIFLTLLRVGAPCSCADWGTGEVLTTIRGFGSRRIRNNLDGTGQV
jgi:hypothetical protein